MTVVSPPVAPPSHAAIVAPARLADAWEHLRVRGGGHGVDGVTIDAFAADAGRRLGRLAEALRVGSWRPKPARRVVLEGMPERPLAIPCVEDRVVQRAIALGLGAWAESRLSDDVCAYRKGRGVAEAIARVSRRLGDGFRWCARVDIESFFDRVDRERLLATLAEDGLEAATIALIGALVEAGVEHGAALTFEDLGLVQGSALSPLLANLYLRPVDETMARRGRELGFATARYADDFCIVARTEAALGDALAVLEEALGGLGLRLSARKTRRGHVGAGIEWLGVRFDASGRRAGRKMLEALAARLDAWSADIPRVCGAHRVWRESYGPLALDDIETLPMLAARVLDRKGGQEALDLEALGQVRGALGDRARGSLAMHVALAATWSAAGLDGPLLLDARAAVRAGVAGDREMGPRLASIAGVEVGRLGVLASDWAELAARLGEAGAIRLAAAARRLRAEERGAEGEGGVTVAPVEGLDVPAIEAWLAALGGRRDGYLQEVRDERGHRRLVATRRALGHDAVRRHLEGAARVALYLADRGGAVRAATLEVRLVREAAIGARGGEGQWGAGPRERVRMLGGLVHDHAMALVRAAERRGIGVALEATGRLERRLWVRFAERVPMRHARALLARIEDDVGPAPEVVRRVRAPDADGVGVGRGPAVALPFGKGEGGRRATLVDGSGVTIEGGVAAMMALPAMTGSAVRAIVLGPEAGPVADAQRRKHARWAKLPHTAQVMAGCAVLRAVADKAEVFGQLEGLERSSVVQALVGLPRAERAAGIAAVLEPVGETEATARRRLRAAGMFPPACATLRERHRAIAERVGCDCVFKGLRRGAYPTPVLHTLPVDKVEAFELRRAQRAAKHKTAKQPRPEEREPTRDPALTDVSAPPSAERRQRPAAKPAPVAETDAMVRKCEGLIEQLQRSRRHIEDAQRGLARIEAALDALFEEAGTDRIRLGRGWLVRRPGPGPRFVIEL